MKTLINSLMFAAAIIAPGACVASAQSTTNTASSQVGQIPAAIAPPTGLPAPVQSVLDYVPTINLSSSNLVNSTIELRVGTTTAANPKDTGAFSDVQCSYEFTKNFAATAEVISGNIGGALENISLGIGYVKKLGNFEISPHAGVGYLVDYHKPNGVAGVLLEIFPIEGNRLGIYADASYSFLLNGQSTGQIKGGCVYAF